MAGCVSRVCESGTKQIFVGWCPQGKAPLDQVFFPQADNMGPRLWLRTQRALHPPVCDNDTGCSSAITAGRAGDGHVPSSPEGHSEAGGLEAGGCEWERLRRAQGRADPLPNPKPLQRHTVTLVHGWLLTLWRTPGHGSSSPSQESGEKPCKASLVHTCRVCGQVVSGPQKRQDSACILTVPGLVPGWDH